MSLDGRPARWQHRDLFHDEPDHPDLTDADLEAQWERSFAAARKLEAANHGVDPDDRRVDAVTFPTAGTDEAEGWRTPPRHPDAA